MASASPTPVPVQDRTIWDTNRFFFLALVILGGTGVLLVLLNTRLGAYTSDDTYYYIYPAREFIAGKGFHPSYFFAPLFPLVLSGLSLLGLDALEAARWLNAVLFGVNIYLTGHLARSMQLPAGFALLAAALVLLSDVTAEIHGWAMSEALAFTFMLLSLDFTVAFIDKQQRWCWWAAALAAAACVLTRYAALPLVAAIGLALLVYAPGRILNRFKEAALLGAASLAPIAAYWMRNKLTSGQPVRYQNYYYVPFTHEQLEWFLYHWLSLFIPGRLLRGREIAAGAVLLVISIVAVLVIGWYYRRQWQRLYSRQVAAGAFLLAAMLLANLLMLFLARGLTELDVFNPRYLVPLLVISLVLLATIASQLWQVSGRWMHLAILGLAAVFLAYYTYRTIDASQQLQRTGLGYANSGWHNSETVAYIRAHPELSEERMVSTGEMGIYFWTGRKPRVIADFPDPQLLRAYLCDNEAVLFLMDQMPVEIYGLEHAKVVQTLEHVQDFNDSEMYRCPQGR